MLKPIVVALAGLFSLAAVAAGKADAPVTKVTFHGHAAFEITTPKGHVLFIDPWLKNPLNPAAKDKNPIDGIQKANYILVTHGHFDHTGDAVELAKKTKARLVTNFELGTNMGRVLGYPSDQMGMDGLMNVGGTISIAEGEVKVTMVPAVHSSGLDSPEDNGKNPVRYGGNPAGFVLQIAGGPTIYHSGDTAYFSDMQLIGNEFAPDLALLNIGGHFGMEPAQAVQAARAVKAKLVVPHHFATFPILTPNTKDFFAGLDKAKIKHREMAAGSSITFKGKTLQP